MALASNQTSICRVDLVRAQNGDIVLPVSGAGSNIPVGTPLMPGVTQGTNIGVAIPITASSNANVLAILNELHNYSASGDALTQTLVSWYNGFTLASGNTAFPSHGCTLVDTAALVRVDYNLNGQIAVASATTTQLTITSLAANADSSFMLVSGGTGIGQLGFCSGTTAGTATLVGALTTELNSTSTLTQILPLFYHLVTWLVNTTTVPTLIGSAAAAGTGRAGILENHIAVNGLDTFLDPLGYHNAQNLNSVDTLSIYSRLAFQDTLYHPNS